MRFTDSPYERLMTQVPSVRREVHGPPAHPSGHLCHGCPYGRDSPCLGICYRKLTKGREKNAT